MDEAVEEHMATSEDESTSDDEDDSMRDYKVTNECRAIFLVYLYYIYKMQCKRYGPCKTKAAPGLVSSSNDGVATFDEFIRYIIPPAKLDIYNPSEECNIHLYTLYPDLDWIGENLKGNAAIEWPRPDLERVHEAIDNPTPELPERTDDEYVYGFLDMRAEEFLVELAQDLIGKLINELEGKMYGDDDEDERRKSDDQASIQKWKERYSGNYEGINSALQVKDQLKELDSGDEDIKRAGSALFWYRMELVEALGGFW